MYPYERKGDRHNKCIYAYKFSDNSIYIGLTYDLDERIKSRKKSNNDAVIIHINKTGLKPEIIQLTNYINVDKAASLEEEYRLKFINDGWNVLNRAKGGSIGGNELYWTYERCKEIALKYSTRNDFAINHRGAYQAAFQNGWLNDIFSHIIENKKPCGYWTYERCKEEALKYNTKIEFKKNSSSAYSRAQKLDWLENICKHMQISKNKIKNYWNNFESCKNEALKYVKRSEFQKQSSGCYESAKKNGWLDEICRDYIEIRKPNGFWYNKENCRKKASEYVSITKFRKHSNRIYWICFQNNWLNEFYPIKNNHN